MLRTLLGFSLLLLAVTTVHASSMGPEGTYYLTDEYNTNGISTLDAIRHEHFVQNASINQHQEGPIAIVNPYWGPYVRTTGSYPGLGGGEYISAPHLHVHADGLTWSNQISNGYTGSGIYDGTSNGRNNFTVDFGSGNVIATGLYWGGPGTVSFSTGTAYDLGITWDRWNNSLWIQNYVTGVISDYSMTGTLLSSFATPDGSYAGDVGSTALAMDIDRTLWFERYGTGYIEHYAIDGTYLGEKFYDGLGYALGGEIASCPEPASIGMASVLLGMFGWTWVRKRISAKALARC
ncbi:MAG: hypothetical protein JSS02_27330 [Planctomycetes bacterium]|nr:hypothetical protein [Planctomycetota bacterium]